MQAKASKVRGILLGVLALTLAGALFTSCGKYDLSGDAGSLRSGPCHVLTLHGSVVSVDGAGRTLTLIPLSPSGGGDTSQVTFRYAGSASRWESIAEKASAGTEVWVSYHEGDLDDSGLTRAGGIYFWDDLQDGAQGAYSWEEATS
jgi:hypothetical protein